MIRSVSMCSEMSSETFTGTEECLTRTFNSTFILTPI